MRGSWHRVFRLGFLAMLQGATFRTIGHVQKIFHLQGGLARGKQGGINIQSWLYCFAPGRSLLGLGPALPRLHTGPSLHLCWTACSLVGLSDKNANNYCSSQVRSDVGSPGLLFHLVPAGLAQARQLQLLHLDTGL